MDRIDWPRLHMSIAFLMAMRSPDPSTQTGAVIVAKDNTIVATGYNGWPRNVEPLNADDPRWNRPDKYHWMAHAERNAIDNAARTGAPLDGCTLYTLLMPCADCARGIVQVGIKYVVFHEDAMREFTKAMTGNQEWVKGLEATRRMFDEAGVVLSHWNGTFPFALVHLSGLPYCPMETKSASTGFRFLGPVSADKNVLD